MDDAAHRAELERMRREIETLPEDQRGPLRELYRETVERHEQIQRASEQSRQALAQLSVRLQEMSASFSQLDAAVSDLRLWAKLVLFDLEARRREAEADRVDAPDGDATGEPDRDDDDR